MARIAINGLGRIGRGFMRAVYSEHGQGAHLPAPMLRQAGNPTKAIHSVLKRNHSPSPRGGVMKGESSIS